jgi:hypothetical protein
MRLKIILKWLRINFVCFAFFFLLTWIVIILYPDFMLRVFGQWAILLEGIGAKGAGDFTTKSAMFVHILTMNSVTLIIYIVVGIFLQSLLVMLFTGVFYSSIAFLAPYTIGRSFSLNDWLLISVELFTLILGISLSSALAGEMFGVEPEIRSLISYWKKNWNKLLPKPVSDWKRILKEWTRTILIGLLIIIGLSLFVAWFETYGY